MESAEKISKAEESASTITPFDQAVRDSSRDEFLTAEEEIACADAIHDGDLATVELHKTLLKRPDILQELARDCGHGPSFAWELSNWKTVRMKYATITEAGEMEKKDEYEKSIEIVQKGLKSLRSLLDKRRGLAQRGEILGLLQRIDRGTAARQYLVERNQRLSGSMAKRFYGDLYDLTQEGHLGILRATEDYNPRKFGTRFTTHATWRIRERIQAYIRGNNGLIRIPVYLTEWKNAYKKIVKELQYEDDPSAFEEVTAIMQLTKNQKELLRHALNLSAVSSLEQQLETQMKTARDPCDIVAQKEEVKNMHQAVRDLKKIDPKRTAVIQNRFPQDGSEPMTLQELGGGLGVTKERVRQIEAIALKKLRDALTKKEEVVNGNGKGLD